MVPSEIKKNVRTVRSFKRAYRKHREAMAGSAQQDVDWKMDPASGEHHTRSKTLPKRFYLNPILQMRIRDPVS
jgi:hypothetical protein